MCVCVCVWNLLSWGWGVACAAGRVQKPPGKRRFAPAALGLVLLLELCGRVPWGKTAPSLGSGPGWSHEGPASQEHVGCAQALTGNQEEEARGSSLMSALRPCCAESCVEVAWSPPLRV